MNWAKWLKYMPVLACLCYRGSLLDRQWNSLLYSYNIARTAQLDSALRFQPQVTLITFAGMEEGVFLRLDYSYLVYVWHWNVRKGWGGVWNSLWTPSQSSYSPLVAYKGIRPYDCFPEFLLLLHISFINLYIPGNILHLLENVFKWMTGPSNV